MLKRKIEELTTYANHARNMMDFLDYNPILVSIYTKLYHKLTHRIKLLKTLKSILDYTLFALFGTGDLKRTSVDDNICDYSGQGRDKYGN